VAGGIELAADPVQHVARPRGITLDTFQLRTQLSKMVEVLEKLCRVHAGQLLDHLLQIE
jgi:hypothetical protein